MTDTLTREQIEKLLKAHDGGPRKMRSYLNYGQAVDALRLALKGIELEKKLRHLQDAATIGMAQLPNDEGIVFDFLAAIHRFAASALSSGKGADEALARTQEQANKPND